MYVLDFYKLKNFDFSHFSCLKMTTRWRVKEELDCHKKKKSCVRKASKQADDVRRCIGELTLNLASIFEHSSEALERCQS